MAIKLDKQQSAAVKTTANKAIVVAGAGSGKTRVITERMTYLSSKGVDMSGVVCITFTNMAADEMKERLVEVPNIGDAFVGTIHAFAHRVMRDSGKYFKIMDKDILAKYHNYLINKYCKFLTWERWLQYSDLEDRVAACKESEYVLKNFLEPSEMAELILINADIPQDPKNYPETVATKAKKDSVITFEELIRLATAYFETLGSFPSHVLVDEFQDVGRLEWNFVQSLNAENYFLVGDDYQAIYSFKGGNVGIFKGLINSEEWTTHFLETNYRNSKAVFGISEIVIDQVSDRIVKKSKLKSGLEGSVEVYKDRKDHEKLIDFIGTIPEEEFKDWFILTRTNKEIHEIEGMLDELLIPCVTFKRSDMGLNEIRNLLNYNGIKILTVHSAKGLESNNVVLTGNFPVKISGYTKQQEERRVMYVGITRAKDKLVIFN